MPCVGFGRTPLSHVVGLSECTAVRVRGLVTESADDVQLIAERLERLQDRRELEAGAFRLRASTGP